MEPRLEKKDFVHGLVSVIIPAYNDAKYLPQTIRSALAQTYHNVEVIVVDDGSTDNTPEVAKKFEGKIKYVHKENGGPASARNVGIKASKGEFIAFLDADCTWPSNKLKLQMECIREHPDGGLFYANARHFEEINGKEKIVPFRPITLYTGNIFWRLLLYNFVQTSTVVTKRSVLEEIGLFDENPEFISVEDYDLWIRIAAKFPVYAVNEYLERAIWDGTNLTSHAEAMLNRDVLVLKKAARTLKEKRLFLRPTFWLAISKHYFELGDTMFFLKKYGKSRIYFCLAFLYFPFRIRALLWAILSFMPASLINKIRTIKKKLPHN